MKKTKKHIWLAIIAIIIAALAFGYAYLTTTLSINGITDIDRNSWDVYFDNAVVTEGSVTGAQVIEAPTITSDTEVEFHVNLKKPGDFYEFTIEARNDGTIDAMINSVSKKLNNADITTLPAYLDYKVTYEDDIEIEDNHLLAAESLETYKIRVEFKKNISSSDLPSTAQSLTLSFGVEYVQADENTAKIKKTVYITRTPSGTMISLENPIPDGTTIFDDYNDLIHSGNGSFLKVILINDVVYKVYIGIAVDGNLGFIQGEGASYNSSTNTYNNDSIYYEKNKKVLNHVFGEENCSEIVSNEYTSYSCEKDVGSASVSDNGSVYTNSNFECYNMNGYHCIAQV